MSQRPTIIDVARVAGVSKTTVSRVVGCKDAPVRTETRQKVLRAIEQLGYERNALAGGLRTDRTYTIALFLPDIANPFWPEVARGIQDVLEGEGYAVVLANSDWDAKREHKFLAMSRRNRFDGLIINPVSVTNAELVANGIPAIILSLDTDYPDFDVVGSDSYGGTTLALEHLVGLGHRRVGLISGLSRGSRQPSRLTSYVDFLQQHHIPVENELIVKCPYGQEHGWRSMKQLLDLDDPPTAIFAANDILAIGALQAIRDAGLRVPQDISLVGMDDIYAVSVTTPSLTTVAKEKYELGCQAATFLLERIREAAPERFRRHALPCRLIQRTSSAPPS
ncbi:MAG: LacI family DNA-binding transcriptional regulator [Chloroflexota bacterium]|nr:LacI family DNA-binding transcriptional regulator [Chloroflexota bacterium]